MISLIIIMANIIQKNPELTRKIMEGDLPECSKEEIDGLKKLACLVKGLLDKGLQVT